MRYHRTLYHCWLSVVRRIAFVQTRGIFSIELLRNSHIGSMSHRVTIFIRHFACDFDLGPEVFLFTPIDLDILRSFAHDGCLVAIRYLVTIAYFATAHIYLLSVHFSTRPFFFAPTHDQMCIRDSNYADRKNGEPFSAQPTIGKSLTFIVSKDKLIPLNK